MTDRQVLTICLAVLAAIAAVCLTVLLVSGSQDTQKQLLEAIAVGSGWLVSSGWLAWVMRDRNRNGTPDIFERKAPSAPAAPDKPASAAPLPRQRTRTKTPVHSVQTDGFTVRRVARPSGEMGYIALQAGQPLCRNHLHPNAPEAQACGRRELNLTTFRS